jgi:hypothetical protein
LGAKGALRLAQAASASAQRAAARRRQKARAAKRRPTGPSGIRWDRVARAALLGTLGVVLLLYISPLHRWLTQHQLAGERARELHTLQQENKQPAPTSASFAAPPASRWKPARWGWSGGASASM